MNEKSSRSHTILRIIIESRERSSGSRLSESDGAVNVSHLVRQLLRFLNKKMT